jgi:hypothetical protein
MVVIVREGKPKEPGVYVAYVNDEVPTPFAFRTLLFWDGEQWYHQFSDARYREHVYQWIGPLPVLRLEDDKGGKG